MEAFVTNKTVLTLSLPRGSPLTRKSCGVRQSKIYKCPVGTYGSERVISFSRRVRVVLHICQQKEWIVPRHSVFSDQLLQPTVVPNVSQKLKEQKNKQAVYHDREGKRKIKKKNFIAFQILALQSNYNIR